LFLFCLMHYHFGFSRAEWMSTGAIGLLVGKWKFRHKKQRLSCDLFVSCDFICKCILFLDARMVTCWRQLLTNWFWTPILALVGWSDMFNIYTQCPIDKLIIMRHLIENLRVTPEINFIPKKVYLILCGIHQVGNFNISANQVIIPLVLLKLCN